MSVNLAAEDLSGYTRRELQAMTWRDLATPESGAALVEFVRAAAGETPQPFELTLRARGGLRAVLEMRVWPVTEDGAPAGYQGIGRNVTERKQAEEAAQQSRRESEALAAMARELTQSLEREEVLRRIVERARTLSESDVSAIALRDATGFTFVAEDGMRGQGLGTSIAADEGLAAAAIAAPGAVAARRYLDDPPLPPRAQRSARAEGIVSMAVTPVRLNDEVAALVYVGTRREREYTPTDLELLTRLAHLSAAALRNASLFTEAETANRALEEALGRANSLTVEAEQAAQVKAEFLATMSHEIRTPLSGVIGMMDLLQGTSLSEEQQEYVGVAHTSAHDLLELINDILDFSKIEAGQLTQESVEFDLQQLVEDTVTLLSARAQERGLALVSFVDPALHGTLRGDPARLRQVLLNLIGNAVKFTEHGHVQVRVALAEDQDETSPVRFAVRDTGIGISATARERLFQPFTQADGSTTRKYGGTDLGLAISRRLVELMGGQIDVQSVEGEGSTFWFTAPLPRVADAATDAAALRDQRVLVVDDLAAVREAVESYLSASGALASGVADGESALAALRTAVSEGRRFDAALLDRALPGIDGLELAAQIRADASLRETRLVLLTALNEPGQGQRARASGFDAFLTKPVRGAVLTQTVARVLTGSPDSADAPGSESAAMTGAPASTHAGEPETWLPAGATAAAPGAMPRVLIVEDNPVNQMVAVKHLEHLGIEAELVANGQEALDAVRDADYDLVFMDCQMPVMDGYAATRAIREQEAQTHRHTPIVAMTANAMPGDVEKCLEAGMDDYLSKPVKRDDLKGKLDAWVGTGSASAESASERATEASPLLNPEALAELVALGTGQDGFVGQLLQLYQVEAPKLIAQCRQAVEEGDPNTLRRAAHTLKGGSANVGAAAVADLAGVVEGLGANGQTDTADDHLMEIEDLYQRTLTALATWLDAA